MAVNSDFEDSLLRNLKLDEPWLPPKPWELIPSESGGSNSLSSNRASSHDSLYDLSSVSEASLVRLVMNALQGVQSAVVSIEQLSELFNADPADRSSNRIPTLWNRSVSTCALGKMLKSIGFSGTLVVLLHKFVDYFTSFDGSLTEKREVDDHVDEGKNMDHPPHSLVNQAFAVAVRKVLEGYICALDTLNASARVRHLQSDSLRCQGSLTSAAHSEVTLLEVYLHTKELRIRIEALGNLCHLHDAALCFSRVSFEQLMANAVGEFRNFPRGANLLSYLYKQLQVVDPAHCTLLQYLFLRSLEPYCSFIRSWIYEAKIDDPYGEFIVEYRVDPLSYSHGKAGIAVDFPLATVREQNGVDLPYFLKTASIPLLRAGQQLQVVMRLLRLCNYVHAGEYSFEDILPGSPDMPSGRASCSSISFNKEEVEATVLSRGNFYSNMQEKLEKVMDTLEIKYHQVGLQETISLYAVNSEPINLQCSSSLEEKQIPHLAVNDRDFNRAPENVDSEASSIDDDLGFEQDALESSECSSTDDSEQQTDYANSHEVRDDLVCSERSYLSALCFSSLSSDKDLVEPSQMKQPFSIHNGDTDPHIVEKVVRKCDASDREPVELSRSWVSEMEYAGHVPDLGWPVGALLRNPLSSGIRYRDGRGYTGNDHSMWTSSSGILMESISCVRDKSTPRSGSMHEVSEKLENPSANSFVIQSWNTKYPCNVLSMNPMFTKNYFLNDGSKPAVSASGMSKAFPCFDFSSARDPFKIYEDWLRADKIHHVEPLLSSTTGTAPVQNMNGYGKTQDSADSIPLRKEHMEHGGSFNLKSDNMDAHLRNACGGSSWQSLLRGSPRSGNTTLTEHQHEHKSGDNFQIPLDFIIDKCLLQEIMLQYIYVSRLSIKMLEGGFDLQDHFLALRRYHFMEIADWADLFITSLWHHKWYFTAADQKIPEIQGLLELSIQRSSCETDHNKDRLYVYMKDEMRTPFSNAAVGVHSFDFIGLGYRVDWPISIVLTPSALRIYAEIFTFLIRAKLAVLFLADAWCSLKDFKHLFNQSKEQQQFARSNFNYLVKLRHQVNHFVLTLQQYVLSQLTHVSWCRFHFSLKHEVKDMMDLESVHMAYLTDSMHICFLADETRSISEHIQSILQCALDFRSCLLRGSGGVGSGNQDSMGNISQINISQVHSLKEKFYKSLQELHKSYLKSPKHGEFGLNRFWSYLNYNDYYSDAFRNEFPITTPW